MDFKETNIHFHLCYFFPIKNYISKRGFKQKQLLNKSEVVMGNKCIVCVLFQASEMRLSYHFGHRRTVKNIKHQSFFSCGYWNSRKIKREKKVALRKEALSSLPKCLQKNMEGFRSCSLNESQMDCQNLKV